MATLSSTITITQEKRPCYVLDNNGNKHKALFHCWSHKSDIYAPSLLKGGHAGGVVAYTVGIVEYEDGTVHETDPKNITFVAGIINEYSFK